ncbi:MAG: cell wall-binding repeat-containing protein, partial [Actinobacteria bacterium]|nr:cell wall-binding repeat-containing protein [Actinomycetota bacterium]
SGTVTRLAGADRYATAIAVSQATSGSDAPRTVYVATGGSFADGLAGTPAAARDGGPLLTLPAATLTPAIAQELRRLNAPRIIILGGSGAVSDALALDQRLVTRRSAELGWEPEIRSFLDGAEQAYRELKATRR